jgi:hypothetical protein
MLRAGEVRVPRHAREAVARHEQVAVVNRDGPAFYIVHPDDAVNFYSASLRGRPLHEALSALANVALPDPELAEDMEAVLADVGPDPKGQGGQDRMSGRPSHRAS